MSNDNYRISEIEAAIPPVQPSPQILAAHLVGTFDALAVRWGAVTGDYPRRLLQMATLNAESSRLVVAAIAAGVLRIDGPADWPAAAPPENLFQIVMRRLPIVAHQSPAREAEACSLLALMVAESGKKPTTTTKTTKTKTTTRRKRNPRSLTTLQREVWTLREGGKTFEEISETMGKSPENWRKHYNRAVKKLGSTPVRSVSASQSTPTDARGQELVADDD